MPHATLTLDRPTQHQKFKSTCNLFLRQFNYYIHDIRTDITIIRCNSDTARCFKMTIFHPSELYNSGVWGTVMTAPPNNADNFQLIDGLYHDPSQEMLCSTGSGVQMFQWFWSYNLQVFTWILSFTNTMLIQFLVQSPVFTQLRVCMHYLNPTVLR